MSKIQYIPSLREYMVEMMPHHLRGSLTVQFLHSIADQLQPLEDLWHALRQKLSVQDAFDYLLDIVGSWILTNRNGDEDTAFRARILAQIVTNYSGGQREDILEILRIIRGEAIKFWRLGGGWAQANYRMDSVPVVSEDQASQIINLVLDPGQLLLSSYTDHPFGFAGSNDSFGFGDGELGTAGDCNCGGIEL